MGYCRLYSNCVEIFCFKYNSMNDPFKRSLTSFFALKTRKESIKEGKGGGYFHCLMIIVRTEK